jgi:hypothetical protein
VRVERDAGLSGAESSRHRTSQFSLVTSPPFRVHFSQWFVSWTKHYLTLGLAVGKEHVQAGSTLKFTNLAHFFAEILNQFLEIRSTPPLRYGNMTEIFP